MPGMGRRQLVAVLDELGELLRTRGTTARMYVVGGAAMALAYGSDRFTHDIDALILDNHTAVTRAVHDIARPASAAHLMTERAGNRLHAPAVSTNVLTSVPS